MATVLYPSPIFGPIHSRRLGISLGINLMPSDGKVCSFDCIYCECGFNKDNYTRTKRPTVAEVCDALKRKLLEMADEGTVPDVITFAGNGEPTAHPDFLSIVEDTIVLRNQFAPKAKVSVLSNGTLIDRPNVFQALNLVDNNILKLDTVDLTYITKVNRPLLYYSPEQQVKLFQQFNGRIIIQTMFMRSYLDGKYVDNMEERFVGPWLEALKKIRPEIVMIYTIDRDTPDKTLQKSDREQLDALVSRIKALGLKATASY